MEASYFKNLYQAHLDCNECEGTAKHTKLIMGTINQQYHNQKTEDKPISATEFKGAIKRLKIRKGLGP